MSSTKLIDFFHVLPNAPMPKPSDPSLDGSISLRAFKHCEPFTSANGYGWYIFPPFDLDLMWDGHACFWKRTDMSEWSYLHTVVPNQFNEPVRQFSEIHGVQFHGSVPFMSYAPEYGIIQMWSGLVVRTKPGWVSMVRTLVNYPHEAALEVLDGIIETDWWIGPLFSVFRVMKSDVKIELRTKVPFAQLQLVRREAYARETITDYGSYAGTANWPDDVAAEFAKRVGEFAGPRRPGNYKRAVRDRNASKELNISAT